MIYIVNFGTCYKIGQTSDLRKRAQAGKDLRIPVSSISLCCSGVYKKAGGYQWKIEKMS